MAAKIVKEPNREPTASDFKPRTATSGLEGGGVPAMWPWAEGLGARVSGCPSGRRVVRGPQVFGGYLGSGHLSAPDEQGQYPGWSAAQILGQLRCPGDRIVDQPVEQADRQGLRRPDLPPAVRGKVTRPSFADELGQPRRGLASGVTPGFLRWWGQRLVRGLRVWLRVYR